jgi:enoyl-[acyl-carrier protein] reductase II
MSIKTRVTELLGTESPILLSGMSWISTPGLVAAVSNAGGLGILATGVSRPEEVRQQIAEVRRLTSKPFGANVTLYFPGAEKNAQVLFEEKVPVVNYSLGKGDWIAKAVHAYGGKVIATVTTQKHALAAQRDGADAVIVTGHEAAGHGGAATSLVLVPRLADLLEIPVIAAGGFADGRGLVAALALGAHGIAMGTRFMNSAESPVHGAQKQVCNQTDVLDTVYTDRVDGLPARVLASTGSRRLIRKHLNPLSALVRSRSIARLLGLPWLKLAVGILVSGARKAIQMARMAIGFAAFRAGTIDGDNERGVLPLGQVAGLIQETLPVAEIIRRITEEAEAAGRRVAETAKGAERAA